MTKRIEKEPGYKHPLTGRPRPQHVRDAISRALKGKPKTAPSYLKGRRGVLHPSYKHGQSRTNRDYDYDKNSAWIQGVKRQSNYRCFITKRVAGLECHHLIGWQEKETRYEIANGVAIHRSIHRDFHNRFGRGGNTPAQFEEYCRNEHNTVEFPWRQGNHKPIFTLLEEKTLLESLRDKRSKRFALLVESRDHEIVEGHYQKNSDLILIHCKTHGYDGLVKAGSYKKARFGLRCCAVEKQSQTASRENERRKQLKLLGAVPSELPAKASASCC